MDSIVDAKVQELWSNVVISCNKVLSHAELYGFQLMDLPNPNVRQIAKAFDTIVIPLLDELARDYELSPESGMKMASIKTYTLHLRAITIAIDKDDIVAFNKNVDLLMSESMLY
ncbi:MAG: hypothetical protein HFP77_00400 [Methylococcales symbiont of Iophon sp. n. MRB-2018]|nr:MAG: hypothetical protein HFP77_00400 [Methylococcales symbiont of Iophon sp. n. MRB-2018]KAF3980758.1 MAG: hypothetical protein HFP76_00440 [Methylococcales symbiont of Iophon sp. n. MRB-2018]